MKKQSCLRYCIYMVLLVLLVLTISFIEGKIVDIGATRYMFPMGLYWAKVLIVIITGAVCGIAFGGQKGEKTGGISVDVPKLLIFGLPLLLGSLLKATFILLPSKDIFILFIPEKFVHTSIIFQLMLGMLIPSCIRRGEEITG